MTNDNRKELFRQMDRSVLMILVSVFIAGCIIAVMDAPNWIIGVLVFLASVGVYSHARLITTIHKI